MYYSFIKNVFHISNDHRHMIKYILYLFLTLTLSHCGKSFGEGESLENGITKNSKLDTENLDPSEYPEGWYSFEQIKSMSCEEIGCEEIKDLGLVPVIGQKYRERAFYPRFIEIENWKIEELNAEKLNILLYHLTKFDYDYEYLEEESYDTKIHRLSLESIKKLSFGSYYTSQYYINRYFSIEQKVALPPESARILDYNFISPEEIPLFSADHIIELASIKDPDNLKKEHVQAIPPKVISQVPKFPFFYNRNSLQGPIFWLTPEQVRAITAEQIRSIGRGNDMPFFGEQIGWLSLDQLKKIREELCEEDKFCNPLRGVNPLDGFRFLSLEQMEVLNLDLAQQVREFTENNKGFLKNPKSVQAVQYSRDRRMILLLDPLEFRDVTLESMNQLEHELIGRLTLNRVRKISVYGKWLIPQYIRGFEYRDPIVSRRRGIIPPFTPEQVKNIPVEQVPDLSLEVLSELMKFKYISAFSMDQIHALTEEQFKFLVDGRGYTILAMAEIYGADQEWIDHLKKLIVEMHEHIKSEDQVEQTIMFAKKINKEKCQKRYEDKKDKMSSYWLNLEMKECLKYWSEYDL